MKVYIVLTKGQMGTFVVGVFASIHAAQITWPGEWVETKFKKDDKYKGRTILQMREKSSHPNMRSWELDTFYMSEFEVQGIDSPVSDFAMAALGGDGSAIDAIKDILHL